LQKNDSLKNLIFSKSVKRLEVLLECKKFIRKSYRNLIITWKLKSNTEYNLSVRMYYLKLYYQDLGKEFQPIKMF
jgi:hypothetical protein